MRCGKFYYYHKNMMELFNINKVIELRHELHQNPELSDNEFLTAERIAMILSEFKPNEIIRGIGGNGIACIYKGKNEGPSVLFRCDMDALPINEEIDKNYTSVVEGVSHKCGHDGHMAIMIGLAQAFYNNPPEKGQVVLLFQPSEENGQGARRVIQDEKFENINIDYAFALHNLPEFPEGSIILRKDTFAAASKGMVVKLYGKTSHAGEPEKGINPAIAMADIIKRLAELNKDHIQYSDFTLLTIIYAKLGEIAFGTSPGYAEVMSTLSTFSNDDMLKLTENAEIISKEIAKQHNLKIEISYVEEFPATINSPDSVEMIGKSAKTANIPHLYIDKPFSWSEDFAHFTKKFNGALFGLGAGEKHAKLHNPEYDFPDEIIESGVKIFFEIFNNVIKS